MAERDAGADPAPGEPGPGDDGSRRRRAHERFERLERAAIEAELETGRQEPTVHAAKVHVVWRLARIVGGSLVLLAGIAMLALPGPGLVVVAVGLGILAQDVPFARRMLDRVRDRLPQDVDGGIPAHLVVLMIAGAVVFTGGSVWFAFLR